MRKIFKINISIFEKNILIFCLSITIISAGLIILKPISTNIFQNGIFFFRIILMFVWIYIISRTSIIMFIKLSVVLWGKSWIWEYRKKFVLFIVNSAMYIFTLISLISIIQGFLQLDVQIIMYSLGFLGVLVGGYDGKKDIII